MNSLRLKLARWILPEGYVVGDGNAKVSIAPPVDLSAVVETTDQPKWTPRQAGNVIIAEPKLVTIERAVRGNQAVEAELDEL